MQYTFVSLVSRYNADRQLGKCNGQRRIPACQKRRWRRRRMHVGKHGCERWTNKEKKNQPCNGFKKKNTSQHVFSGLKGLHDALCWETQVKVQLILYRALLNFHRPSPPIWRVEPKVQLKLMLRSALHEKLCGYFVNLNRTDRVEGVRSSGEKKNKGGKSWTWLNFCRRAMRCFPGSAQARKITLGREHRVSIHLASNVTEDKMIYALTIFLPHYIIKCSEEFCFHTHGSVLKNWTFFIVFLYLFLLHSHSLLKVSLSVHHPGFTPFMKVKGQKGHRL